MKNELLYQSGQDIPFLEAQLIIHNPKIKEIAVIGESSFWTGCQFLNFSRDSLKPEDKSRLSNQTDFEIFMSIMNSKDRAKYKVDTRMVLTLLFPTYEFEFSNKEILFKKDNFKASLNNMNFEGFKEILNEMFGLGGASKGKYNPADGMAAKLAERFKEREAKLAKLKGQNITESDISILSRYVSILSVGESKDKNELMNYTVFQLKDELERFQLKQNFDITLEAKMAGAQDIEEAKNWMGNLYDGSLNT